MYVRRRARVLQILSMTRIQASPGSDTCTTPRGLPAGVRKSPGRRATGANGLLTSCKPSSVHGNRGTIMSLGPPSPMASSTPPVPPADHGCDPGGPLETACACTRWGLPCPARHRTGGALLPHRFTLACGRSHIGGLFSVALSLTRSPRAGGCYPPPSSCRARTFLEAGIGHAIVRSLPQSSSASSSQRYHLAR